MSSGGGSGSGKKSEVTEQTPTARGEGAEAKPERAAKAKALRRAAQVLHGGAHGEAPEVSREKRTWAAWSLVELDAFFQGLAHPHLLHHPPHPAQQPPTLQLATGGGAEGPGGTGGRRRDWDLLARLVGSKSREQVRHLYYRCVKKVSSLLLLAGGRALPQKRARYAMRALRCFWELRRAVLPAGLDPRQQSPALLSISEADKPAFAARLLRLLDAIPPHLAAAELDPDEDSDPETPAAAASSSSVASRRPDPLLTSAPAPTPAHQATPPTPADGPTSEEAGAERSGSGGKVTLQLVPRSRQLQGAVSGAGFNPRLQLVVAPSKTLGFLLEHLRKKWVDPRTGRSLLTEEARLFPPASPAHPGWGPHDPTPLRALLAAMLASSPPVTPTAAPSSSSSASSSAAGTEPLKLEYWWPLPGVPARPLASTAVPSAAAASTTTTTAPAAVPSASSFPGASAAQLTRGSVAVPATSNSGLTVYHFFSRTSASAPPPSTSAAQASMSTLALAPIPPAAPVLASAAPSASIRASAPASAPAAAVPAPASAPAAGGAFQQQASSSPRAAESAESVLLNGSSSLSSWLDALEAHLLPRPLAPEEGASLFTLETSNPPISLSPSPSRSLLPPMGAFDVEASRDAPDAGLRELEQIHFVRDFYQLAPSFSASSSPSSSPSGLESPVKRPRLSASGVESLESALSTPLLAPILPSDALAIGPLNAAPPSPPSPLPSSFPDSDSASPSVSPRTSRKVKRGPC
jgi:hypothetical protein